MCGIWVKKKHYYSTIFNHIYEVTILESTIWHKWPIVFLLAGIWKGCWSFFTCGPRLSIPIITTGHFDMAPGELRLKAWHSRVMVAFLAVCLQQVVAATPPAERSLDLTLIATATLQISNWNLDLENCPIDLAEEQANRLYDDGMQHLLLLLTWFYCSKIMLPKICSQHMFF